LYGTDGLSTEVSWEFHAAIRVESDNQYHCPDEDAGCPLTAYALCAFDGATTNQTVAFMTCWDDQDESLDGAARTKACAGGAGLDAGAVGTCATGSKGAALQKTAADYFMTTYPTHAHSGIFSVPNIQVDGARQDDTSYNGLVGVLCSKGVKSTACSAVMI